MVIIIAIIIRENLLTCIYQLTLQTTQAFQNILSFNTSCFSWGKFPFLFYRQGDRDMESLSNFSGYSQDAKWGFRESQAW